MGRGDTLDTNKKLTLRLPPELATRAAQAQKMATAAMPDTTARLLLSPSRNPTATGLTRCIIFRAPLRLSGRISLWVSSTMITDDVR